ncbi:hypothetical protein R1flu_011762 [Riccia fluitans]|uniref:Uncharacterized protein n=1 Tax=Riccia fluitans TaxID=41844 RepID=A0ABD1Z8P7_9MARC
MAITVRSIRAEEHGTTKRSTQQSGTARRSTRGVPTVDPALGRLRDHANGSTGRPIFVLILARYHETGSYESLLFVQRQLCTLVHATFGVETYMTYVLEPKFY